jgi:hypothetical protein
MNLCVPDRHRPHNPRVPYRIWKRVCTARFDPGQPELDLVELGLVVAAPAGGRFAEPDAANVTGLERLHRHTSRP